jgi:TAG lipase / steryl ester hydrolase / phospholipase A2 / LPA acyltransferase
MAFKPRARSALRAIDRALGNAQTYAEWRELATEHDRLSGAADWREADATDLLHTAEIRKGIATMRSMREAGAIWPLTKKLQEVLFRHQGEFTHPALYQVAKAGTHRVVTDFLDEVETCVRHLIALEVAGVGDDYKLEQVKRIGRVYGRPALMLSGGGTLAIYHFGVVKALFEQELLPRTISGSSMGAIIAAWVCCHDDQELRRYFANPRLVKLNALRRLPLKQMQAQRALFDQAWLLKYLRSIMPDLSFAESKLRSRRILNISVSPHNARQSARVLNFLSAPEALVHHAVLASCAIPAVFKPVQLMARHRGVVTPWMEDELWVDGSVNNDLPFFQLSQMLNINHYITSQANPHIVPFLAPAAAKPGRIASVARMGGNIVIEASTQVLDVARRHALSRPVRETLNTAHAVSSQRYAGADMHIQLPLKLELYTRLMTNPSFEQFKQYIRLGEQATWPRIPMIRDRTRLSRLFGDCIGVLTRRMAAQAHATRPRRRGKTAVD